MNSEYHDILSLPYPYDSRRMRMALTDRAAQFAPFAALAGYEDGIAEKGRLKKPGHGMSEYQQAILDQKIRSLLDETANHPDLIIQYVTPDAPGTGPYCSQLSGRLKQIDPVRQLLVLEDRTVLRLDQLLEIFVIKRSIPVSEL